MTTENNQMTDSVSFNTVAEDAPAALEPLSRPVDSAAKAKWVDYVVALGADRAYTEAQDHTAAELRDLADRLGG